MKKKNKRRIESLESRIKDLQSDIDVLLYGTPMEQIVVKFKHDNIKLLDKMNWQGDVNIPVSGGFLARIEEHYNKNSNETPDTQKAKKVP